VKSRWEREGTCTCLESQFEWIASRFGENSGVGFAIPTNTIQRIVPILIKDGKVTRADIGVHVIEKENRLANPGGFFLSE